ncbi:MAG: hypothetical protein ABIP12_05300 [Terriglobales bacterium]
MRYLLAVTVTSIVVLAALIGLRFVGSQYFAPTQSGVHGLAVHAPVDVVFIGSSHTRQSYDARLLEEKTGRKVFLIAYNGMDPVSMVPVLKSIFAGRDKPKLVVVEAYGAIFGRPHAVQDSRLFFEADPRLKRELLAEFSRPPRTLDKYLDAFALLANRNNEGIVAYPINRLLLPNLSYRGAYADKFVPGLTEEQFRKLRVPLEGDVGADPEQRAALRELVRLARAANVPIIFAESPLPAPVTALPVMQGLKASLKAALAEEGVEYFDGEAGFPLDDPTLFADSNHLSTKGRAVFTERVAAWIVQVGGKR